MKLLKDYIVLIAILFVVAMWLLTPPLIKWLIPPSENAEAIRGQFGDMYGFVTSLFSGITIIGLVYTIVLQREDIRLSRQSVIKQAEELELTKQALINQQQEIRDNRTEIIQNREEIKLQHETVKFQRFDNTFFNLLKLNLELIDELDSNAFQAAITRAEDCVADKATKEEMVNKYRQGTHPKVKEKLIPFTSSMFYFLKWICDEQGKEGRATYLPLVFSQLRKIEKEFLYYQLNLDSNHPNIKDFDSFLLEGFDSEHRISIAKKVFAEW